MSVWYSCWVRSCLHFLICFYSCNQRYFQCLERRMGINDLCIMMNKSLGGTTMTVKWRIIGTFLGAFTSFAVWKITDANVYALCLTGVLISIPSFYIIMYWKRNNAFGRFILLTYNLTALYSYSMIQKDSEDDNEGGDNNYWRNCIPSIYCVL